MPMRQRPGAAPPAVAAPVAPVRASSAKSTTPQSRSGAASPAPSPAVTARAASPAKQQAAAAPPAKAAPPSPAVSGQPPAAKKAPSSPTAAVPAAAKLATPPPPSASKPVKSAAPPPPSSQAPRDRAIALFAAYEPSKVQHVDVLVAKLNRDPAKLSAFIEDYIKRNGPEPPSKEAALRAFFVKHYKNDAAAVDSAMQLVREVPGIEVSMFAEIHHAPRAAAPPVGGKAPPSAATPAAKTAPAAAAAAKAAPSSSPPPPAPAATTARKLPMDSPPPMSPTSRPDATAAGATAVSAALSAPATAASGAAAAAAETAAPVRKRSSTCDRAIRDRTVAMLAAYDPDSLLVLDEDADLPDSALGAAFLDGLVAQHGPEPASKRAALERLLARLLEQQDPQRMRSLATLVAATEAPGAKDLQVVRAMFQAYGLAHRQGKAAASLGLAPAVRIGGVGAPALLSASGNADSQHQAFASGAILAPWTCSAMSAGSWSPDASVRDQRGAYLTAAAAASLSLSPSASPKRLAQTTAMSQQDILRQLESVPRLQLQQQQQQQSHQRGASHARQSSFSELLGYDDGVAVSAVQIDLGAMSPAARGGGGSSHVDDTEDDDGTTRANPFLRAGASPAQLGGADRRAAAVPLAPQTPGLAVRL